MKKRLVFYLSATISIGLSFLFKPFWQGLFIGSSVTLVILDFFGRRAIKRITDVLDKKQRDQIENN